MGTQGPKYTLFGHMDPYTLNPYGPLFPKPLKEPLKEGTLSSLKTSTQKPPLGPRNRKPVSSYSNSGWIAMGAQDVKKGLLSRA